MHFGYVFPYVAIKYINSFEEIKLNELYIYNLVVRAEDGIVSIFFLVTINDKNFLSYNS